MENEQKKRIRKPEGVFVMSILLFLNFGVYQFVLDFNEMRASNSEIPILIVIVVLSLDIFSAGSAIWAFFGDNSGRIALLTFVSLNMLWSIFILILTTSYAKANADGYYDKNIFLFGFSLLKPLFLFGLSWWYFTQKKVIAYYKQENKYEFL